MAVRQQWRVVISAAGGRVPDAVCHGLLLMLATGLSLNVLSWAAPRSLGRFRTMSGRFPPFLRQIDAKPLLLIEQHESVDLGEAAVYERGEFIRVVAVASGERTRVLEWYGD